MIEEINSINMSDSKKTKSWYKVDKIHFVGIGGIGVSALAKMMLLLKKKVSGSDISLGEAAKRLKEKGVKVSIGHKKSNLTKNTDLVIYSPAIKNNNPELLKAKELNIPTYSYPQALGLISKDKETIAISGTHGKTTTVAMVGEIMLSAKKNPTIVIGSFMKKQKDNFVMGKSQYFVVEACEYKRSFLHLLPKILVITNIDNDHLDYYKNIQDIQKAFSQLISKVPADGFIITNPNHKNIKKALKLSTKIKAKIIDYTKEKKPKLKIPGEYNILNAKAAIAVAKLVGAKKDQIEKSLKNFSGTWRRFEYKRKTKKGALIYDDYAHHPTEVKVVLGAVRESFPNKKIIAVFQPHLYSRTKFFLNEFSKALNNIDEVIITDIYAAREKKDKTIHAKDLVKKTKNARYVSSFSEIKKYLINQVDNGSIIITLGAGDVYKISEGI